MSIRAMLCSMADSADDTQAIGTWLVQRLTSDLSPEILVAVLDAIIEIYADEAREYDVPVFVAGGYLEALTSVIGRVRSDVSGEA